MQLADNTNIFNKTTNLDITNKLIEASNSIQHITHKHSQHAA